MKSYENTFIRGPSPSYSDDAASENAMSVTLTIGAVDLDRMQCSKDNFLDEKFNGGYATSFSSPVKSHGRNTFAFWTVVVTLLVLCVGNLALTLTIMGVLRLGKGIHGMEPIPEEGVIKFYGSTDLDRIYSKVSGKIEGFSDEPMTIAGTEEGVFVRLHRNGQWTNRLSIDEAGIQFNGINTVELKDPTKGDTIFTTHRPHYNIPSGAEALVAKTISLTRIVSPIGKPLKLEAENRIAIKGSEGIIIDASSALLQAEHNININSTQGAIVLEAGAGIFLDMEKIPIVSSEFGLRTGSRPNYKLCVCMPQGMLFRIPIPRIHNAPKITCAHFSSKHDPCVIN